MMDYVIYGIGFLAQLLFSARLIIQWIKSEKAQGVVSPTIFWQLSLIASFLLMIYGILRDDLAILLGQVFSYFVYIRNLQLKNAWKAIPRTFKACVIAFPILTAFWLASDLRHNWQEITHNPEVSGFLLGWGSSGQIIFSLRFVYQWISAEKSKKSVLPLGFWLLSLVGALMIIVYGIYRRDPVLILGQVFGLGIYARNVFLLLKKQAYAINR